MTRPITFTARTDRALRDPRTDRPWFVCGQNSPDFGHVWADAGLDATILYFDAARTIHASTEFRVLAEGEAVEIHGFAWTVTWAPQKREAVLIGAMEDGRVG